MAHIINVSRSILLQAISKIIVFGVNILLARYLFVNTFGELNFLLSINFIIGIVVDLGSNQFGIKNFSDNHAVKQFNEIFSFVTFKVVNYIFILPILFGIVFFDIFELNNKVLYVLLALPLFDNIISTIINFYAASFRFKLNAYSQFLFDVFKSIITALFFLLFGINGFLLSLLFYVIIFSIVLVNKEFNLRALTLKLAYRYFQRDYRGILKLSSAFFVVSFLTQLYLRIEVIVLKYISASNELGIFSSAFRLYENMLFVPASIIGVFLPVMNNLVSANGVNKSLDKYRLLQKFILIAVCPLCISGIFFSKEIVFIIYGSKYSESSIVLLMFFVKFFILSVSSIYYNQIIVYRLNREISLSYLFALILQILIAIFCIKNNGPNGAAFSAILSEILVLITYLFVLRKNRKPIPINIRHMLIVVTFMSITLVANIFFELSLVYKFLFFSLIIVVFILVFKSDINYLRKKFLQHDKD